MEKKDTGYIYKITSPTGRVYIGQAVDIVKRKREYKNLQCKNQRFIYNSLKCYSLDKHKFEIIEEPELDFLNIVERYWIALLKTNKRRYTLERGLNLTDGGDGGRGIKWSQKSKDKASKTHMGRKKSPEHCANISKGRKGLKASEETKEKLRKLSTGNKYSLGNKHTEEAKLKMSKSKKGKPCPWSAVPTPLEVRKKISETRILNGSAKGGRNPTAKQVLDTETGIYYDCLKDASTAKGKNYSTIRSKLNPKVSRNNNTSLIYI